MKLEQFLCTEAERSTTNPERSGKGPGNGSVNEAQRLEFNSQDPRGKPSIVPLALAYSPSAETGGSVGLSSQPA